MEGKMIELYYNLKSKGKKFKRLEPPTHVYRGYLKEYLDMRRSINTPKGAQGTNRGLRK